jgi:hypothetical protein
MCEKRISGYEFARIKHSGRVLYDDYSPPEEPMPSGFMVKIIIPCKFFLQKD